MQELFSEDEDENDLKRTFAESEETPSYENRGLKLEITESSVKNKER
jgi:hypothetical protein